jgi:hypothetical protein
VLTLTTTSALTGVRLTDPLPGGLTVADGTPALFTRIDESGKSAPAGSRVALGAAAGGVTADLGALEPGKYVLTYPARPGAVGSYTALPAVAAPDDPTVWARSGSNSFILDR